jgi:hypothetical protein
MMGYCCTCVCYRYTIIIAVCYVLLIYYLSHSYNGLTLTLSVLYDAAGEMQSKSTQVPHSGLTTTMNYITLYHHFGWFLYTYTYTLTLYTPSTQ